MSSQTHRQRGKTETGAVLVVSLLFLLVLTLIGLTGMQVTSLEEKMSGNMRDRNLAFQAAESALRAGEMYLTLTLHKFSLFSDFRRLSVLASNATARRGRLGLRRD